MTEPLSLRASRGPLAWQCAESIRVVPGEPVRASGSEQARLGTATHEVMAAYATGNWQLDLAETAAKHMVDLDDLTFLYHQGRGAWAFFSEHFPKPVAERLAYFELNGIYLSGHADLVSYAHPQVRGLDWKTGRLDEDHEIQARLYALLELHYFDLADSAYWVVVRLRDYSPHHQDWFDGYTWTRVELLGWWEEFAERLKQGGYNPGVHCGYCPRNLACSAALESIRGVMQAVLYDGITNWTIDNESLRVAYIQAHYLEGVAKQLKADIKGAVIAAGGTLGRLAVVQEKGPSKIVPHLALPVLRDCLDEEDIESTFTIGKTKLEKVIGSTAERGNKGKRIAEVMGWLDEAGAIKETWVEKLEVRNVGTKAIAAAQPENASGAP